MKAGEPLCQLWQQQSGIESWKRCTKEKKILQSRAMNSESGARAESDSLKWFWRDVVMLQIRQEYKNIVTRSALFAANQQIYPKKKAKKWKSLASQTQPVYSACLISFEAYLPPSLSLVLRLTPDYPSDIKHLTAHKTNAASQRYDL